MMSTEQSRFFKENLKLPQSEWPSEFLHQCPPSVALGVGDER